MIATIGYERASLSDFIATLKLCGIDMLIDIRDRAQSRRAGFSKGALSDALAEADISYLHMRELGDPKEGREAARRGDYDQFRAIFSGVMESDEAKQAISTLEQLASQYRICLMCFERDQTACHRKIVADHLEVTLDTKARHLGVKEGAGKQFTIRRMCDSHQSAAAPI
jgi:uncharacterized protein (DUF488 family)